MKRQRGMLLIAAVVLILIASVMGVAILTLTTGSAGGGAQHLSATQAYYIAETGIERGIYDWKNGNTPAAGVNVGAGSYTVTEYDTGFDGATLPNTEKRIHSEGSIASTGAKRVIEVIAGPPNLMPPWANTNFNQVPGTCIPPCQPTGWSLTGNNPGGSSYIPWEDTGGPDGSRAAYVYKDNTGPTASTTAGTYTFSPPVAVTGPTLVQIGFDYNVELLGNGNASNYLQLQFSLGQQGTSTTWNTTTFQHGKTTGYVHGTLWVLIANNGPIQIGSLTFNMKAKAGQRLKLRLDNITLSTIGYTTPQILDWREVYP